MINRKDQRGMGYLGYMIVALVIGLLVKVITTAGGPYLDHFYVDRSIKSVLHDNAATNASVQDIQKSLSTQFAINNITDLASGDLNVTKDGNVITVSYEYEIRQQFMGNCDVVFKFKNSFSSEENHGAQ